MPKKEENLISIDEVIFRAKKLDIDFGKGNPRERLRYLTKLGLLPHAKRKSFNGKPPNGAYPEYVIELLKEIDEKIKTGKSIQEIKREKEKKGLVEAPYTYISPPLSVFPSFETTSPREIPVIEKEIPKPKPFAKINKVLKIVFLILISSGIIFFLTSQTNEKLRSSSPFTFVQAIKEDFSSYLFASLSWIQKLVQVPTPIEQRAEEKEVLFPPIPEPYLTINAETDINAPLNVKEEIRIPSLSLIKGEFKATLTSADLTAERTYTFPDLSGTICLTTGNCVGLGGEVFSPGGIPNRLAKFITSREISLSSINDFYLRGVAITIDSAGEVGIGIENPGYPLHVRGRIQATGDICTNLRGGKCLSELAAPSPPIIFGGAFAGIGGSGIANYLPIWTGSTNLGNSIIYQSGSNIGIDTTNPTQKLEVAGTIKILGFQLPTNATSGYILTSDEFGFGTWKPAPSGVLPSGLAGQTLRHDGTNWVANYFLYNTGTTIGIGTTSTLATLTLSGNALFATTTLPQLVLKYDDDNYLRFSITSTSSAILASKSITFNSLTGEIKLWDTSIKKGEYILRASVPIFKFPVPAQTISTEFVATTKEISTTTLNSALPTPFPGATRKIAFLLNFADNIATNASSTWLIDLTTGTDTEFSFAGQNLFDLSQGVPHLSQFYSPPGENWQLKVKVPSGKTIRIFNIFLLAFDQIQ